MQFNSWEFTYLVLITFSLYYFPLFKKAQIGLLIIASLVFYGYRSPELVVLLLTSALITHFISQKVAELPTNNSRKWAISGVIINLSILIFFKYSGLIGSYLFFKNITISIFLNSIPLPIGISFYTFQGISLLLDTFHKNEIIGATQKTYLNKNILYIIFFPQLVSGPILKANDFIPQIQTKSITSIDYNFCFHHLIVGYFLKMVIADNLKDQTAYLHTDYLVETLSTCNLLVLIFGYSCQIFADFAGYSYIARGLAGLFGYNILMNFNYPYNARSFMDFWRRWNISLSNFLKEYLYFSIGGNKKNKYRTYFNILITMMLGGLWHGASINYLLWGFYHGILLIANKIIINKLKIRWNWVIQQILVFILVSIGWLFFIYTDSFELTLFTKSALKNINSPLHQAPLAFTLIYSMPILLMHILKNRNFNSITKNSNFRIFAYAIFIFLIILNSGSPGQFIYFKF